jgi:hypothetical protein
VIPVSAAIRAADGSVLLGLASGRGSLARLRADPRVAVLVLAEGDLAMTIYGAAVVVEEEIVPGVAAVSVTIDRTVDHGRRTFVIESGVAWSWTDEAARSRDANLRTELARISSAAGPQPPPNTS